MTGIAIALVRRPATTVDEPLLARLFAESRDGEFALLPPDVRSSLVEMQFAAARRSHAGHYPAARDEVIEIAGRPVGWLLVDSDAERVRVVDIAIAADARGTGIGTAVLTDVISGAGGRPVTLSVWSANSGARRLYERLGFRPAVTDLPHSGGYVELVHTAQRHED